MKTEYLPFRILLFFNLVTLLFFVYSPVKSVCHGSHWITVLYVLLNICCWAIGYKIGIKRASFLSTPTHAPVSTINKKTFVYFFIFYLITLLPKYAYELSRPVFDVAGMIERIAIGLKDPAAGYYMSRGVPPYNWSIYVLISVIDGVFITIGLLCWKRISVVGKFLFIIICILEALKWFGKGTNFGVIMMLISILFAYLARRESTTKRRGTFKTILLSLIVLFLALVVFSYNMESRSGGDFDFVNEASFNLNYNSPINKYIVQKFPQRYVSLYGFVVNYITGGYTHLECAFQCSNSWSMFMGSNPAKANMAEFITGMNIEEMGYPHAIYISFGVDPRINWHSCYAWLANDFGLGLVPFIVLLIGRYTGISLMLYRKYNDLLSGVVFISFSCMCFFFFANNNYISSIFYSFMVFFPLWFFTRIIQFKAK